MTRAPRNRRAASAGTAVFAICAGVYVLLGDAVSHVPPHGLDAAARGLAGHATGVAWIFTASCLWPTLLTLGLIGCAVAALVPAWRARIIFSIVVTIGGWQISNGLKDVFQRPRPAYWYVYHETTFSYSSGHAMFATVVYWLWAFYVARSPLPSSVRLPLAALLAIWGAGVVWSRMALGAHYPTDLIGGILLGVALIALGNAVAALVAPESAILSSPGTAPHR